MTAASVVCALTTQSAIGSSCDELFDKSVEFRVMGYAGTETLTDFPVLVRINSKKSPDVILSECGADGCDIRFTDEAGNLLSHEVDFWDADGGAAWVRLPELPAGGGVFRLWFAPKQGAELPAVDSSDVWRAYVAVVHDGTVLKDSSPSGLTVSRVGDNTASADGLIGGGASNPSVGTARISIENPFGKLSTAGVFTSSAWYKHDSAAGTRILMGGWPNWNASAGWLVYWELGNELKQMHNGDTSGFSLKSAIPNKWYSVAAVYGATDGELYMNGSKVASGTITKTVCDTGYNWSFGNYGAETSHGDSFTGVFDEMRIYDGKASSDWLAAEYDCVMSDSFVEQVWVPTLLFGASVGLVASGYGGTSELRNFPVLVRLDSEHVAVVDLAACGENGEGIRFTDSNGTLIPHEVDYWDAEHGRAAIWVRLPVLQGKRTSFTLHYDPVEGVTLPAVDAKDVWQSYVAVVHDGAVLKDSSPFGLTVSRVGDNTATESGIVGGGSSNVRGTSRISLASPYENLYKWGEFTVSAWFNQTCTGTTVLMGSWQNWNARPGWLTHWQNGVSLHFEASGSTECGFSMLPPEGWYNVTLSFGGGYGTCYVNGISIKRDAMSPISDAGIAWGFGNYGGDTSHGDSFEGRLDEMRVYDGVASDDWVAAEYASIVQDDFVEADVSDKVTVCANSDYDIGVELVMTEANGFAPAAGKFDGCETGTTVEFFAPSTNLAVGSSASARVTGWRIYVPAGASRQLLDSGPGCYCSHRKGAETLICEWQFEYNCKIEAKALGSGQVVLDGNGVAGTAASVTAAATDAAHPFRFWMDETGAKVSDSPTYAFTISRPTLLMAVFGETLALAPFGETLPGGVVGVPSIDVALKIVGDFTNDCIAVYGMNAIFEASTDVVIPAGKSFECVQGAFPTLKMAVGKKIMIRGKMKGFSITGGDAVGLVEVVSGGELSACTITGCTGQDQLMVIDGGTISGCMVTGNTWKVNSAVSGAEVELEHGVSHLILLKNSGVMRGSVIAENVGRPLSVVYATGGSVEGCRFANMESSYSGGIYSASGRLLVDRCTFSGLKGVWAGALDLQGGSAVILNTLISDCSCTYGDGIGYAGVPVAMTNCTFVGNGGVGLECAPSAVCKQSFCNLIIWHQDGASSGLFIRNGSELDKYCVFDHCCLSASGAATIEEGGISMPGCLVVDAPGFVDGENADYRLAKGSPCRGTGAFSPWMRKAKDVAGVLRASGGKVDIGCYQSSGTSGFVIFFQ